MKIILWRYHARLSYFVLSESRTGGKMLYEIVRFILCNTHLGYAKFISFTKLCRFYTRVIFYVRRIGLYLYKYRIFGTISIYILKGLAFVYPLM